MVPGLSCEYQVMSYLVAYVRGAHHDAGEVDLEPEWHPIRIVMAEMIHFIRSMYAYCQLEVIECSWKILTDFLQKKEGDLDALIDVHRTYLDRMVHKALLLSPKSGKEVRSLIAFHFGTR